jgi:hypothetical protein
MTKKIYLALPYTGLINESFKAANEIAGELINKGNYVFSPISHSHPIWIAGNKIANHEVWLRQDREFVKWCDEVHVVILGKKGKERIKQSHGVQQELKWAKEFNKKVKYIKYV